MTMNETLGDAIRRARQQQHLTQGVLGARVGVGQAQLSAWETGRSAPTEVQLARLSQALGMSFEDARPADDARRALRPGPVPRAANAAGDGAVRRRRTPRRATELVPAAGPLDVAALEQWLWAAACQIRGPLDAPKFKDYILPLIFLKRLSDVFDDDVARVAAEVGDPGIALTVVADDHGLVRFFIPDQGRWSFVREPARWSSVPKPPASLGEALTDAVRSVARINPRLEGVIDPVDFNATAAGQPIIDNDRLRMASAGRRGGRRCLR